MNKNCDFYQSRLIDIFYDELEMDDDTEKHITDCSECDKYWQELNLMKEQLDIIEEDIPIEYMKISQAFDEVEKQKLRRKNFISLVIFVLISSAILSLGLTLALSGFATEVVYFQITIYILGPILLPVLVKARVLKEEYYE